MTSKEAILELICEAKSVNIDEGRICFLRNIIEKDLEILEILKPMLEIKKGSSWEYLDTKHCFFDTQEQIEIIKEWFKNDRN